VDKVAASSGGAGPEHGDPVEAARSWLADLVARRDLQAAWRHTDPDYRLALTQAVIFLNDQNPLLAGHDRDALAGELSRPEPDHPLWPSFAGLLLDEFLDALAEIDLDNWRATALRTVGSGLELVLFEDAREPRVEESQPEMYARGILMQLRDDRWMAAGLSARRARPGWPPDLGY
jgi:hypothetical protein